MAGSTKPKPKFPRRLTATEMRKVVHHNIRINKEQNGPLVEEYLNMMPLFFSRPDSMNNMYTAVMINEWDPEVKSALRDGIEIMFGVRQPSVLGD